MNQEQFLGAVRVLIPLITSLLVSRGFIPAASATDIGTAFMTVITDIGNITVTVLGVGSVVLSYRAHSDKAKIAAVTAMPDIKKVVTATHPTNSDVAAAAADPSQTKVSPSL